MIKNGKLNEVFRTTQHLKVNENETTMRVLKASLTDSWMKVASDELHSGSQCVMQQKHRVWPLVSLTLPYTLHTGHWHIYPQWQLTLFHTFKVTTGVKNAHKSYKRCGHKLFAKVLFFFVLTNWINDYISAVASHRVAVIFFFPRYDYFNVTKHPEGV